METKEDNSLWTLASMERYLVLNTLEDAHESIATDLCRMQYKVRDLRTELDEVLHEKPEQLWDDPRNSHMSLWMVADNVSNTLFRIQGRVKTYYPLYRLAGQWRVLFNALDPDWRDDAAHKSMPDNIGYAAKQAKRASKELLMRERDGAKSAYGLLKSVDTLLDDVVLRQFLEDERVNDELASYTFPYERWDAKLEAYRELHE